MVNDKRVVSNEEMIDLLDDNKLLEYSKNTFEQYFKLGIILEEIMDVLSQYDITIEKYDKYSYLEERFLFLRKLLVIRGLELPSEPKEVSVSLDDFIYVIENIRDNDIDKIESEEISYNFDGDEEFYNTDAEDEYSLDFAIIERKKLYEQAIEEFKEKYQTNDSMTKKLSL